MSKIVLVGYMGAGKTSVGKNLSLLTNIPFFDLDYEIEKHYHSTITELFTTKGEIWFRKTEHLFLKNFIKNHQYFILSLGGGTPCYANNHLFLKQDDIISIYLKANIETIIERLSENIESRPILNQNKSDLKNFIGQHLFERSYFYNHAKFKIETSNQTILDICKKIEKFI